MNSETNKTIKHPKKVENFLAKPSAAKAIEGKAGIKYDWR